MIVQVLSNSRPNGWEQSYANINQRERGTGRARWERTGLRDIRVIWLYVKHQTPKHTSPLDRQYTCFCWCFFLLTSFKAASKVHFLAFFRDIMIANDHQDASKFVQFSFMLTTRFSFAPIFEPDPDQLLIECLAVRYDFFPLLFSLIFGKTAIRFKEHWLAWLGNYTLNSLEKQISYSSIPTLTRFLLFSWIFNVK